MVFTVGHSTHEPDTFLALLERHDVELLCDVRMSPGSRRVPWTGAAELESLLGERGIGYLHLRELGGRRRPAAQSQNGGWDNEQFRGYADHMDSTEFRSGLARLLEEASARRACAMCAEAAWWRCHRRLLSDALLVRGARVEHIGPDGRTHDHELTEFAVVDGARLSYPPTQESFRL